MSTTSSAAELLRHSIDTFFSKDMAAWAALCADNVVVEFPFAPDAASQRIEGRQAIYEYLRHYPATIDVQSIPSLHIHETSDPAVAIAEWSVSGRVIANGNPYEMRYATFLTVRDGLIVNYREYWNPMAFLAALGGGGF